MTYPLILAPQGQEIMRINHDATTSVQWDKVLRHRFEALTKLNVGIVRICEMVWAAKDNFVETPWDVSDGLSSKWSHYECHLDYLEQPPSAGNYHFVVSNENLEVVARVNNDGTWAVDWPEVVEISRFTLANEGSWQMVALIGFCRLLVAARDRFRTVPWMILEEDC